MSILKAIFKRNSSSPQKGSHIIRSDARGRRQAARAGAALLDRVCSREMRD